MSGQAGNSHVGMFLGHETVNPFYISRLWAYGCSCVWLKAFPISPWMVLQLNCMASAFGRPSSSRSLPSDVCSPYRPKMIKTPMVGSDGCQHAWELHGLTGVLPQTDRGGHDQWP